MVSVDNPVPGAKPMPAIAFIYALVNPEDNRVFYIGKTNKPKRRLQLHFGESKHGRAPRHRFIRDLALHGTRPYIRVLAEVPFSEWEHWEKFYIAKFKADGATLVNATEGGGAYPSWAGKHHTDETKRKISTGNKGKPHPPMSKAHREKLSLIARTAPRWNVGLKGYSGRAVHKYSLDGQYLASYATATEAGEKNAVGQSTVTRCCNKKIHRAKDAIYRFEYFPGGVEPFKYCHETPVQALDFEDKLVATFDSLKEGARWAGINPSNISECLRPNGRQQSAGGYVWRRVFRDNDTIQFDVMRAK